MKNPNGPYPGRQLFLGQTVKGQTAFAYLVTGRSPQSRERKATPKNDGIVMGPIGNAAYDPLRHYTAVKYDNSIGLIAVSNGIQTEAVFETYRLLYNVKSAPAKSFLKKIMDGANYESDSLKTPRIAAAITSKTDSGKTVYLISIKIADQAAYTWQVNPGPGTLTGVSTYYGDMENPGAFKAENGLPEIKFDADTPQQIADFIYEISAATYHGDDIRVCAIGGVRTDNTWKLALINRHKD